MKGIDFQAGITVYDEFHIDFTKSFLEQLDSLKEDLLLVEYEDGYLLDLGWYPEYEADGKFVIQLIKDGRWAEPQYKASCRSQEDLLQILKKVIGLVCT